MLSYYDGLAFVYSCFIFLFSHRILLFSNEWQKVDLLEKAIGKEISVLTIIYLPAKLTIGHIPIEGRETVIRIHYVRITSYFQQIKQSQFQKNSFCSQRMIFLLCVVFYCYIFLSSIIPYISIKGIVLEWPFSLLLNIMMFCSISTVVYECVFLPSAGNLGTS